MRNIKFGVLLFCMILMISCSQKNSDNSTNSDIEAWDSVKSSTNHYDYFRFLINNTDSRYFDTALIRYFKYQELLFDSIGPPMWDCFDRCISVVITKSDSILFENEPILIDNLSKKALSYLKNENNDEWMPEQKLVKDKNGFERYVSNGFFYLQTDLESNHKLKKGINEIKLAYNDYKNYLSEKWFRAKFDKLDPDNKELIDNLVKQRFEIGKYYKIIINEDELSNE